MSNALTALDLLGPQILDHHECIRTQHYLERRSERNFDEGLLPELWLEGEWTASDHGFVIGKRISGAETWELVVAIVDSLNDDFGTPWLVTVWSQTRLAA